MLLLDIFVSDLVTLRSLFLTRSKIISVISFQSFQGCFAQLETVFAANSQAVAAHFTCEGGISAAEAKLLKQKQSFKKTLKYFFL